jgi:transposase
MVVDISLFKTARQFGAWLGLVDADLRQMLQ